MRTVTETRRIGEHLGPIDWTYNFRAHFDNYGSTEKDRLLACEKAIERLRQLTDGSQWEATTDGGSPRFCWQKVLEVGMYDGWPYWRPVPSVLMLGPLGGEWHSFCSLTDISKL